MAKKSSKSPRNSAASQASAPAAAGQDGWRLGGWLDGPTPRTDAGAYPGQRLGMPESGPGSVAAWGSRIAALVIDWLASLAIARLISSEAQLLPLVVLFVEHALLVSTLGTSLGHRLLGIRVVRLGAGAQPLGLVWGAARSLLLVLVIPAVIWDTDRRGMHDRLTGSVVVRG